LRHPVLRLLLLHEQLRLVQRLVLLRLNELLLLLRWRLLQPAAVPHRHACRTRRLLLAWDCC
jgi:hypothetical protein